MAKRFVISKEEISECNNFSCKFRCSFSNDSVFALLAFAVLARLKLCKKNEIFEKILLRRLLKLNEELREAFLRVFELDKVLKEDKQVFSFSTDTVDDHIVRIILSAFKEMIASVMEDEIIRDRIQNNYLLCHNSILAIFRRFSSVFRIAVVFVNAADFQDCSYDYEKSCPVVFICQENDQSFSVLAHQELVAATSSRVNLSDFQRFPFVLDRNNLEVMKTTMENFRQEYFGSHFISCKKKADQEFSETPAKVYRIHIINNDFE